MKKSVKKDYIEYIWTLADGTEIHTSHMGDAKLRGVTTGGPIERPFIAYIDDSWVPANLRHLLYNKDSKMHQLGCYKDSRDAAAVSALAQDPDLMAYMLEHHQSLWLSIHCDKRYLETDLCESRFDIDEKVTNSEIAAKRAKQATARKAKTAAAKALKVAQLEEDKEEIERVLNIASKKPLNSKSAMKIRETIVKVYGVGFSLNLSKIANADIRILKTFKEWDAKHGQTS